MKKRGFTFFGTTICYAYMQAVGMVNDHTPECSFK
jgi:DNA-3-methyladenine glycosylase I